MIDKPLNLDALLTDALSDDVLFRYREPLTLRDSILAAIRPVVAARLHEAEQALRNEWWLSHGHDGLYGDDGEMQCSQCGADYKRDPLDVLRQKVTLSKIERLGRARERADKLAAAEAREAALREFREWLDRPYPDGPGDGSQGESDMVAALCIGKLEELGLTPPTRSQPKENPCSNGHVWFNQFGDDYTPDPGTRCECGETTWRGR
jgi:hypothetical protein